MYWVHSTVDFPLRNLLPYTLFFLSLSVLICRVHLVFVLFFIIIQILFLIFVRVTVILVVIILFLTLFFPFLQLSLIFFICLFVQPVKIYFVDKRIRIEIGIWVLIEIIRLSLILILIFHFLPGWNFFTFLFLFWPFRGILRVLIRLRSRIWICIRLRFSGELWLLC